MHGLIRKRLQNLKRATCSLILPTLDGVSSDHLAVICAFSFSYSIGRTVIDVCKELELTEESRILIVGASGGRDYHWLRGHHFRPDVMDLGTYDWCRTTYVGDACRPETWERLTHKYDLIVMCDVLEHLPEDYSALKFARNALAPTGALFLSVPFRHDLTETHVRSYTWTTLQRLLKLAGFSVEWSRQRPGILEAYPRTLTAMNYGIGLLLGSRVLRRLLEVEYRINDRSRAIYNFYGRSPEKGALLLCRPAIAADYVAENAEAFFGTSATSRSMMRR